MNASSPTQAETAERLDTILASVLLLVAACFRILGVRTVPLWNRISRSRRNLAHLLARLAAGHKPRIRKPAAIAAEAAPTQPAPTPLGGAVTMPIPRRPLWLVIQLGYRAAGFGSQLNHLLHEPGVAETLAAPPRHRPHPAPALPHARRRPAARPPPAAPPGGIAP